MSNRISDLIPTPASKGGRRATRAKRAQRARLVLSWVRAADLLDTLLDDLDAAVAAGAVPPDEVRHARWVLVSATEEMIGTRPRLIASK